MNNIHPSKSELINLIEKMPPTSKFGGKECPKCKKGIVMSYVDFGKNMQRKYCSYRPICNYSDEYLLDANK